MEYDDAFQCLSSSCDELQRLLEGNDKKKKAGKKEGESLEKLSSFNFRKKAKKLAQRRMAKMPKNMGADISLKEEAADPLSFAIAKEILEKFEIYAISDIERLFVHEPSNGHFTEMDQRRFSLFLSQAYHDAEVEKMLSDGVKKEAFSRLLSAPNIQISQDLFDAQERFVNVANGVVDLATGKLKKHDANRYGFLGTLPFQYIPKYSKGERMPRRFKMVLEKTFPDKNDRKRFLQCLAYLISNDCSKKVAFFWVGKPHTGKSTFQRLIARIVGKENFSTIPLEKFSNRFSIASMFGKKLNMAGETSTLRLKALEVFKSAVGNDWIDAEYKGQDHFTFLAKAKNLFCGNSLPVLSREIAEKAIYDRFEFLEFQNPIPKKQQRPFFEDELLEKEGDKILTVIIRELRNFYKNGRRFKESKSSLALKQAFKKEAKSQDSVRAFMKDCCTKDSEANTSIGELCQRYDSYCRANGFDRLTNPDFINELVMRGKFTRKRFHPSRTIQYRGLKGIALLPSHTSQASHLD